MMGMTRIKAQSAMEFLMTYGWAILIISVVLGALFSLGVFSSASLTGTTCTASTGYLCKGVAFNVNGNLSFTFGQATGRAIYNVGMACAGTATSTGLPNPSPTSGPSAMVYLVSNGFPSSLASNPSNYGVLFGNTLSLANGQSIAVSALNCYGASGADLINLQIGASYSGGLWINYTLLNQAPAAGANPLLTSRIGTLTAKVTSS